MPTLGEMDIACCGKCEQWCPWWSVIFEVDDALHECCMWSFVKCDPIECQRTMHEHVVVMDVVDRAGWSRLFSLYQFSERKDARCLKTKNFLRTLLSEPARLSSDPVSEHDIAQNQKGCWNWCNISELRLIWASYLSVRSCYINHTTKR